MKVKNFLKQITPYEILQKIESLEFKDCGHGFDVFGAEKQWVQYALLASRPLYKNYFRIRSFDSERIPTHEACILAANHSGTLPLDGVMLYHDVIKHTSPSRLPRAIADNFVSRIPFINTIFSRVGVVNGTRGNLKKLIENKEMLMIFPEGVPGIGKIFWQRYQLQNWREGHAEFALRYRVPVVPVAIIGPEEQMPQIGRLPGIKKLGIPYIPLTLTPLPLPVRYHIHYGEPLYLHELLKDYDPHNPEVITEAALIVKKEVQNLIAKGLKERKGVFE